MNATQEELWLKIQDEIKRIDDLKNSLSKELTSDENVSSTARPTLSAPPRLPKSSATLITDALANQPGIDGQKGSRIAMPTAAKVVRKRCHISYDDYGFKKAKQLFDYLITQGQIVYDGLDQGRQPLISVKGKDGLYVPECTVEFSSSQIKRNSSNWFDGMDIASLEKLASIAMPEPWDFPSDKVQYSILSNYLCNTFTRLWTQKKVVINEVKHLAALNTGLLYASSFEPIYALFEYGRLPGNRWHPLGFCHAGVGTLGKKLLSSFNNLPARASYFDGGNSPVFDPNATIQVDFDHLLSAKNLSRLPLNFLRHLSFDDEHLLNLCRQARCETGGRTPLFYERLAQIFTADDTFPKHFRAAISGSLKETQHRIGADYRMAIPMWNPHQPDYLHFLLPLYLSHDNAPDVTLIVQQANHSTYQGLTLLSLEQSYLDARLLSRLDGSWLSCIYRHDSGQRRKG